jgi:hypothetical protein
VGEIIPESWATSSGISTLRRRATQGDAEPARVGQLAAEMPLSAGERGGIVMLAEVATRRALNADGKPAASSRTRKIGFICNRKHNSQLQNHPF